MNDPLSRLDNQAVQSLAKAITTYTAWRLGRDEALSAMGESQQRLQQLQAKRAGLVTLRDSVTNFAGDVPRPAHPTQVPDADVQNGASVLPSGSLTLRPALDSVADNIAADNTTAGTDVAPPDTAMPATPTALSAVPAPKLKKKSEPATPPTPSAMPITPTAPTLSALPAAPPAPKLKKKSEDDLL